MSANCIVKNLGSLFDNIDIVKRLLQRCDNTIDFPQIRLYNHISTFIYHPELMQGGAMNYILLPKESKYLGKGYSMTGEYIVKETKEGIKRTVVLKGTVKRPKDPLDGCHLYGEVYALTPVAILNLDRYLDNEYKYSREKRSFILRDQESPFKDNVSPMMMCQVHIGYADYWDSLDLWKKSVLQSSNLNKWIWAN